MDTNFKHWLFADPLIAEVEGWSIPGFGRPKPQQQPAAPTENTAGVQQEVERLAKELELWDRDPKTGQEDNWLEKSPMLRRAMTHLITVLHPQVGQGGMLMWNMLQSITDALIRKAKDRHPEGKVDPNVDETLQQAGTPTRLVKYLKGTWRAFNPKATIEGSMPGKSAEDNQAVVNFVWLFTTPSMWHITKWLELHLRKRCRSLCQCQPFKTLYPLQTTKNLTSS
jgi:hypothetical protein